MDFSTLPAGGRFSTRVTERFLGNITNLPQGDVLLRLLLYDFTTGFDTVLQEHARALHRYLLPQMRGAYSVWVGGLASRAGDEDMNRNLAAGRAAKVTRLIEFMQPSIHNGSSTLVTTSFGERRSVHGSENDMHYRAVLVIVLRQPAPVPLPRPPRPPAPFPLSSFWRIALLGGGEFELTVGGGFYQFRIDYDPSHPTSPPSAPCDYNLWAAGGGISLPAPAGSTGYGEQGLVWNRFRSQKLRTPDSFSGRASWGGWGIAIHTVSVGSSTLYLYPSRQHEEIGITDFEVASSVSQGISRIYGGFVRA